MTVKTYLSFDVGTKRTGIAIANSLTAHASGIETILHKKMARPIGLKLSNPSVSISQINLLLDCP